MLVRQLKAVVVIALIAIVAACSFKTVYNRLDYLVPEYVEGVVTLDDLLEQRLEQRTIALLQWHRNTQLQQYAGWLQSLQRDVGTHLTQQQLEHHINEMEAFWLSLYTRINDDMAYLLPLLDEEQREELFIYLEDSNEEFREDFIDLDDDERIEDYAERMINTYENWIGELTDEQEQSVEQAATQLISTAELRLMRRVEWQQGIRQILSGNDSRYDKGEKLKVFLAGFEQDKEGAIKQASDINRQIIIRLTVQIAHSMSQQQKDFFISKTSNYIRMFTELAENR